VPAKQRGFTPVVKYSSTKTWRQAHPRKKVIGKLCDENTLLRFIGHVIDFNDQDGGVWIKSKDAQWWCDVTGLTHEYAIKRSSERIRKRMARAKERLEKKRLK
jgi:hypothetical protein